MTTLWLLVALVAGVSFAVQRARRGGPARRAARSHHRVLDTLDTITRQAGEHPVRAREADDAHTHVRLVRDGDEERVPALRPTPYAGRTLGAAPFRAPTGGSTHEPTGEVAPVAPVDPEEQVRVARAAEPAVSEHPAEPTVDRPVVEAPVASRAAAPLSAAPVSWVTAIVGQDPDEADRCFEEPTGAPVLHLDAEASTPAPPAEPDPEVAAAPLRSEAVAAVVASGRIRRRASAEPGHRRRRRPARRRAVLATGLAAPVLASIVALEALSGGGGTGRPRVRPALPIVQAPPTTTPTTAPAPPPPATLVSSSPVVAVFSLSGPATITLTASGGASWIQLRQGDQSGNVAFEGRLDPGQAQSIAGPAWVRLGNPTVVTVAVDRTPVSAPAMTAGQPYNLQFRWASSR